MAIFKLDKNKLVPIKELKIDLERDIQKVTEENLEAVFGLKFVSSEFSLHNFRIDTLAFDKETKAFVIIEYKKNRSFSITDQGLAYLNLMLTNKGDFIVEYQVTTKERLDPKDVDWSQSKVVFIAGSFTPHQQRAVNFKDFPFELWAVKKYGKELVSFTQIKPLDRRESFKTISKAKEFNVVQREIKTYSVDDHFKPSWTKARELFEELQERIFSMDSRIEESPQKYYIGYKIESSNFIQLKIRKSKIVVQLLRVKPRELKDPETKVYYKKNSFKYYHKHISQYDIKNRNDIDYAAFLIKQVYERFYR